MLLSSVQIPSDGGPWAAYSKGDLPYFRYYEGRPINKLQNGIILLIFKI